jgi:predicted transcriptional regulator of viral defense system
MLNAKGVEVKPSAVREMLSQIVKDEQIKNVGRGQYVHPDYLQNILDNADTVTNGKGNVSLSVMSGHICAHSDQASQAAVR